MILVVFAERDKALKNKIKGRFPAKVQTIEKSKRNRKVFAMNAQGGRPMALKNSIKKGPEVVLVRLGKTLYIGPTGSRRVACSISIKWDF